MEKNELLTEVLRRIFLEIRLLSSGPSCNYQRINKIADIAHNIPMALLNPEKFDEKKMIVELKKYEAKYESSGIKFVDIFIEK